MICHGGFDKKKGKFFLGFEHSSTGELLPIYPDMLDTMLAAVTVTEIKLVFINACHSEVFGHIFRKYGIKLVIAITSNLKIEDTVASLFSQHLYTNLFKGEIFKSAFEIAIS